MTANEGHPNKMCCFQNSDFGINLQMKLIRSLCRNFITHPLAYSAQFQFNLSAIQFNAHCQNWKIK